jgi:hypothetical protein
MTAAITLPAAHFVQIRGIRPSIIVMKLRSFTPVSRKPASALLDTLLTTV